MDVHPHISAIYLATDQGAPMVEVAEVEAVADRGLVGDRYYLGTGYYSGDKVWDANVTLIEQGAFRGAGDDVSPRFLRRNLVTQGIDLKSLLGKDFRIGTVLLRGTKEWPPCKYLDGMHPQHAILQQFAHTGGIGATVLTGGHFRVGDTIEDLGTSDKRNHS